MGGSRARPGSSDGNQGPFLRGRQIIYLYIKGPGALGEKLCGFGAAGVPKLTQRKGAEREGKGPPSSLQNGSVFETFPGGHLEKTKSVFPYGHFWVMYVITLFENRL